VQQVRRRRRCEITLPAAAEAISQSIIILTIGSGSCSARQVRCDTIQQQQQQQRTALLLLLRLQQQWSVDDVKSCVNGTP
jgi:hypothetical protein